ncbi:hypothetical protein FACS189459_0500 [Bacilli bacterium]|nr:hypothetical protein FACS189459_0500 [Bacilli bacterium]
MKQVLINFRVDEYKKEKAERLCESLGLNLSSLINILLTHSINVGGIPFPLLDQVPSENNIRFEKM